LLILTTTRSGELRGATWSEFLDSDRNIVPPFDVWVIPGERMKAGREHRIPLSPQARALIQNLWQAQLLEQGISSSRASRIADSAGGIKITAMSQRLLFSSVSGKSLSDMTLTQLMRREQLAYTAHGFRSSFRDWCAEQTTYPREICERALAHQLPDKVEAAYLRSDYLDKRRQLMADWAAFVCSKP
jgi:integrase